METTLAPTAPTQLDFRAELHHLIDQIQDEAILRAALLLLSPHVEPELSLAWQKQIEVAIQQLDAGQDIPASEAFAHLMKC